MAGKEIESFDRPDQDSLVIRGRIAARGIGAVLAARTDDLEDSFWPFLAAQARTAARFDAQSVTVQPVEQLRPASGARRYRAEALPTDMVAVPATSWEMHVQFTEREVGEYQTPRKRLVESPPFAIDLTPVTNAQFARFLASSGYRPRHAENYLKHWVDGRPPAGHEDHPVVYVDLEDARAYARWAGKRLPTEEQWQLAAGGPQQWLYPWGNQFDPRFCNAGQSGGTTPATAFPDGRSPLGVYDMCGNTWEWTESERHDGHSRFCIIKGGSFYKAQGSHWYADGGPQPVQSLLNTC